MITTRIPALPVVAVLILGMSGIADAATYTLSPSDDAYVFIAEPSANFGTEPVLTTGITFLSQDAFVYLKFDLSAIPENEFIVGATLNLYQAGGTGVGLFGTEAWRHDDDSWSEATITWDNAPLLFSPGTGPLLAVNPNLNDFRGWSLWDLFETGSWDADAEQADGFLTLLLAEDSGGDNAHTWCSKESDPALDNCVTTSEPGGTDENRDPFLTVETQI
ncbi:MAG: DNRLRE domain-containing protein, partial [Gammaproteobacteria bacterium]|nr:DNRLRE domain-containing protein [Gammaproteobacteria bacterium]